MSTWQKENNQDKAIKVILFLVSPFFSFLYSLRNMKTKSSFVVFFLFAVFFGMSFTISEGYNDTTGLDGAYYRDMFEFAKYDSFRDYMAELDSFFSFNDGKKDYYADTVSFFVSRFSDNYHVMFMVFAIIFAFFSLKSFKILTSEDNFDTSIACFILAYLFMINQIFNINGVRFWTAAWIGVYSILQIFVKDNKHFFPLAFITPFFHGSYWIFIAVLLIAFFLRKFEKFWIVLFFISFFITSFAVDTITSNIDILPPFLAKLATSYTDTDYIKLRNTTGTGYSWVADTFKFIEKFYINLLVFLFIKNSSTIKSNPKTKNLYLFILVWMVFVNFFMYVPSLGVRYVLLAYPLITYVWLMSFKDFKYKNVLYAMPVIFSFHFFGMIYNYYPKVLEPIFYFSNPFYLIYKYLIV